MSILPRYTKQAMSIEEQIKLLQSRGLIIDNYNEAVHYLNNISYYHISGYLKPFQDKNDDFRKDTKFTDILELYFFDRKLRLIFLNAIERIEKSFKTQFILHLSTKYGADCVLKENFFVPNLKKIDENLKTSKEPFIRAFKKKYSNKYPPLWMIAETLSFGDILSIYAYSIPTEDKKAISVFYGMGWKHLNSWLENLREVRNICAHYSRLWNRRISKNIMNSDLYSDFTYKNHIYDSIIATQILLNIVSPSYEFLDEITAIIKEYNIPVSIMGFSDNWEETFINLTKI